MIACVDGLTGFPDAIEAVYPKAEIQKCVIHQIRNTTRFVSYKDIKQLMADLKRVYAVVDESTALAELGRFSCINLACVIDPPYNTGNDFIYAQYGRRWRLLGWNLLAFYSQPGISNCELKMVDARLYRTLLRLRLLSLSISR